MDSANARDLIQTLRYSDPAPGDLDAEQVVLARQIFTTLQGNAVRLRDPALFKDWLTSEAGLPVPAAQAIVIEVSPLLDDAHALILRMKQALAAGTDRSLDVLKTFRESPAADELVHRRSAYASLGEDFDTGRWGNFVATMRSIGADVRATVLALVEMYSETGWAAHDLLPSAAAVSTPGEQALRDALTAPDTAPLVLVEAFDRRLREIGVGIRIVMRDEGVVPMLVHLAMTDKWSMSVLKGVSPGSDMLSVALPYVRRSDEPPRLAVATVTARRTLSDRRAERRHTMIHVSAVHRSLTRGLLSWTPPGGTAPMVFHEASIRSYASPFVVNQGATADPQTFSEALAMTNGTDLTRAVNTLAHLADAQVEDGYPVDDVIMASFRPLGAVSGWENVESLAPEQRLMNACDVILLATRALAATAECHRWLFMGEDSDASLASDVFVSAVENIIARPDLDSPSLDRLGAMTTDADRLGRIWSSVARADLTNRLRKALALVGAKRASADRP